MKPAMNPVDTPDKLFHDGSPETGVLGDEVHAVWLNAVQDSTIDLQKELAAILTAAKMVPDGSKPSQVLAALGQLFFSASGRVAAPDYGSNLYADDGRKVSHLYINKDGTAGAWDDVNNKALPLIVADATKPAHAVSLQQLNARAPNLKRFELSGKIIVPDGVYTLYLSGCAPGGGGGGGGCRSNTNEFGGGGAGGGAGQSVIKYAVTVTPGETVNIVIGSPGTGGKTFQNADGSPGGNGGDVIFGKYLTLKGGEGGTAGGGANRQYGGAPGKGYPSGSWGIDGGGSNLTPGTGNGGAGASGPYGGGGGAPRSSSDGSVTGNPGLPGYGYGAGGAGGSTGVRGVGSDGMPGLLIVEW